MKFLERLRDAFRFGDGGIYLYDLTDEEKEGLELLKRLRKE